MNRNVWIWGSSFLMMCVMCMSNLRVFCTCTPSSLVAASCCNGTLLKESCMSGWECG